MSISMGDGNFFVEEFNLLVSKPLKEAISSSMKHHLKGSATDDQKVTDAIKIWTGECFQWYLHFLFEQIKLISQFSINF